MEQNLKLLIHYCQRYELKLLPHNKVIVIPIYCFINKLINSLQKYVNSSISHISNWAQFIVLNQNIKNQNVLSNIIGSWYKYKSQSLQCQLLSNFLRESSIDKIRFFIKLRKYTTVLGSSQILDQILLTHEDIIGILHKSIKMQSQRKTISNGVKKLLISYKVSQPKIHSSVFIQYVLSLYGSFESQYREARVSQAMSRNNKYQSSFDLNFKSNIHDQNGLYRKVKNNVELNILERKFLSPKINHYLRENQQGLASRSLSRESQSLFDSSPNKSLNKSNQKKYRQIISQQLDKIREQKDSNKNFKINFNKFEPSNASSYKQPINKELFFNNQKSISSKVQDKFIKILDQQNNDNIPQKPYGYQTWQRMIKNNEEFKQRMLKSNIQQNNNYLNPVYDSINQTYEFREMNSPIQIRQTVKKKKINWQ